MHMRARQVGGLLRGFLQCNGLAKWNQMGQPAHVLRMHGREERLSPGLSAVGEPLAPAADATAAARPLPAASGALQQHQDGLFFERLPGRRASALRLRRAQRAAKAPSQRSWLFPICAKVWTAC